jgi:DNA repair ATPase RecN
LQFSDGLNVLYGASNTGKSFGLKVVDFMLGSSTPLPGISEREPYERAWLTVNLPDEETVTLRRALAGGPFEMFSGIEVSDSGRGNARQLSARHDSTNTDNLSQFLLDKIGLGSRQIVTDAHGKKRSLSFCDLSRYCIVDETAIQSETSPALSGQYQSAPAERSIFRLLVTGADDSAVVPIVDPRTFRLSNTGKVEMLDEMIGSMEEELTADYPAPDELADQEKRLEESWQAAQRELDASRDTFRELNALKWEIVHSITRMKQRQEEIALNVGRFEQLGAVYGSDIQRLYAIEEAGFLLSLGGDRDCPLCGASPEHQKIAHGLAEIEQAQEAATVEIQKIREQSDELDATLVDLQAEAVAIRNRLIRSESQLEDVDARLDALAPVASDARTRVNEISKARDEVRRGLALIAQKAALQKRREEITAMRAPSKSERPKLEMPGSAVYEFTQTVSNVLSQWQFPGNRHVAFDEATFDLRIDGKLRRDNGKGVRAITHAAFKVGLLLFGDYIFNNPKRL